MLKNVISNISLALAFITANFFSCGLAYQQSYLAYWGLEESSFSLSFERTLFQGFIAMSAPFMKIVGPLIPILIICFVVMLFLHIRATKKSKSPVTKTDPNKQLPAYMNTFLNLIVFLFSTFMIIVFFYVFLQDARNFGNTYAKEQYDKFISGKGNQIVVMLKDNSSFNAYSICSSESHYAFLIGDKVRVLPLSDISVLESTPNEK